MHVPGLMGAAGRLGLARLPIPSVGWGWASARLSITIRCELELLIKHSLM